jgi:hypothetical protein
LIQPMRSLRGRPRPRVGRDAGQENSLIVGSTVLHEDELLTELMRKLTSNSHSLRNRVLEDKLTWNRTADWPR